MPSGALPAPPWVDRRAPADERTQGAGQLRSTAQDLQRPMRGRGSWCTSRNIQESCVVSCGAWGQLGEDQHLARILSHTSSKDFVAIKMNGQ